MPRFQFVFGDEAPNQLEAVADNENEEKNSQQQNQAKSSRANPKNCGVRMNDKSPLFLWRLPAGLDVNQVAEILGFLPHVLTVLLRTGLLKPLGKPAPNGHKFFSAAEMLALSENREWLDKATRAVAKCWKDRNLATNGRVDS